MKYKDLSALADGFFEGKESKCREKVSEALSNGCMKLNTSRLSIPSSWRFVSAEK